jgi:hypothetical protein
MKSAFQPVECIDLFSHMSQEEKDLLAFKTSSGQAGAGLSVRGHMPGSLRGGRFFNTLIYSVHHTIEE